MMSNRRKFTEELKSLLKKYDVRISADDHWTGYAECGQDVRMTIEFSDWRLKDIDAGSHLDQSSDLTEDA